MNTFGTRLKFTSFGESHGVAVGCVIDGLPAGVRINEAFLQAELDKRRGGKRFTTPRKESDKAQILSGVFEGLSTGTPLAIVIYNENQHSKDYENIKDLFRPAHADLHTLQNTALGIIEAVGEQAQEKALQEWLLGLWRKCCLMNFT